MAGLDGDDLLEVGFAEVQTFPTQVRVLVVPAENYDYQILHVVNG